MTMRTNDQPEVDVRSGGMDELRFAVSPIVEVDVRDASDSHGFWTMSGYAAVFDQKTTLYDGKLLKLTEEVDRGFFDRVLREQPMGSPDGVVHFNLGHDMNRSVASTDVPRGQPGSLQLEADEKGLFFLAKVPKDDPDGVAMAAKMRSGVLRQASFAFTVAKDKVEVLDVEDGPEIEHRTLLECKHLYDVCATPQGAFSSTVVGLRSFAAALGQPVVGDPAPRQPTTSTTSTGDEFVVSPIGDGGSVNSPAREKAARSLERYAILRDRLKPRKLNA